MNNVIASLVLQCEEVDASILYFKLYDEETGPVALVELSNGTPCMVSYDEDEDKWI